MTVGNQSGVKQFQLLTPHRRHISKAAARGHKKGVTDQCFTDDEIRGYILQKIGKHVYSEVKTMCSSKVQSLLQKKTNEALKEFKWDTFMSEIKVNAPVLYNILLAVTKTKQPRSDRNEVIGMLLNLRFPTMNLVQKIIALIMYAGRCEKQVCNCVLRCCCFPPEH